MFGIDPAIWTPALQVWIAAGSAALVVAWALVFVRSRSTVAASLAGCGLVVLGAVLGAAATWAFLDGAAVRDRSAERRALEMRAEQLSAQALAPGSPLACLDAVAGEIVETACERAVFAAPASVASAISYVAARFALFADMVAYTRRGGTDIDNALNPLRVSLEADPFGFLAHVLVMRDGCTAENCKALDLLNDPSHVRTNLIAQTLDHYVEHYREAWAKPSAVPVAEGTDVQPAAAAQLNGPPQRKVVVNIDFPTAASIPPISIMNPEPKGLLAPGAAPAAAAAANPSHAAAAAPGRRSHKPAAKPPAQNGAPAAAASPAAEATQTDPVWTPAPASTPQ